MIKRNRLFALPTTVCLLDWESHVRLVARPSSGDKVLALRSMEGLYRPWYAHVNRAGLNHDINDIVWLGSTAEYRVRDWPDYEHVIQNPSGELLAERVTEAHMLDEAEQPRTGRVVYRPPSKGWSYQVLPIATTRTAWAELMLLTASLRWNPGNRWSPGFLIIDFRLEPGRPPHKAGVMLFGTSKQQERVKACLKRIVARARVATEHKGFSFVSQSDRR